MTGHGGDAMTKWVWAFAVGVLLAPVTSCGGSTANNSTSGQLSVTSDTRLSTGPIADEQGFVIDPPLGGYSVSHIFASDNPIFRQILLERGLRSASVSLLTLGVSQTIKIPDGSIAVSESTFTLFPRNADSSEAFAYRVGGGIDIIGAGLSPSEVSEIARHIRLVPIDEWQRYVSGLPQRAITHVPLDTHNR